MAFKYTLKNFGPETEPKEGGGRQIVEGKTRIGFTVEDESGNLFLIDKVITTGTKSQETITEEAYALCQDQVNEWAEQFKNIGKEWNPTDKKFS